MEKYFFHPATCIQYQEKKYAIKNAIDGKICIIDDLKKIIPTKEMIERKIFCPVKDIGNVAKNMFNNLECNFIKSETAIGYIETTSKCPYTCRMCPKFSNHLERSSVTMPLVIFKSLIDQLMSGSKITLHLFGDPLCDDEIIEKIICANNKNIVPSFSTNLISLYRLNINDLSKLKLGTLTISMDAISAEEMSGIRGKTTKKQFDENLVILECLVQIQEKLHFAENIVLQSISMKGNEKVISYLKKMSVKYSTLKYFEKPYINFPSMENTSLEKRIVYKGNEWIWIYDLLGMKKPYRCLKLWNKLEFAILSDGSFVPCCLCFNETEKIGNVNIQSLSEIYNSQKFYEFRRRIFYGDNCGVICNKCVVNGEQRTHKNISQDCINYLKKYCIDGWQKCLVEGDL